LHRSMHNLPFILLWWLGYVFRFLCYWIAIYQYIVVYCQLSCLYALVKIIGKFWGKTVFLSRLVFFVKMGIFPPILTRILILTKILIFLIIFPRFFPTWYWYSDVGCSVFVLKLCYIFIQNIWCCWKLWSPWRMKNVWILFEKSLEINNPVSEKNHYCLKRKGWLYDTKMDV